MKPIVIRPSGVKDFMDCPRKWLRRHVLDMNALPNIKADQGSSVHKAVQHLWEGAIQTQTKEFNMTELRDVGVQDLQARVKRGEHSDYFDEKIDYAKAESNVLNCVDEFVGSILPYTEIPEFVEIPLVKKLEMGSDNPMVSGISGTADYLGRGVLADIKTSSSKKQASSFKIQQGIYKMLAEHNGYKADSCVIQGLWIPQVKAVHSSIEECEVSIPQVNFIIQIIIDKLKKVWEGADPEAEFPGNTGSYMCSNKWCNFRPTCPFVHGHLFEPMDE